MKPKRKLKEAFNQYLYDSSIDLKDRSFVLFSASVLMALYIAIPCGLIMGEPLYATISTAAGAVVFSIYVFFAYRRRKIKQARIVISVFLVFFFLPAMFFTNGGVFSGAPIWMLLGSFYMILILDGKFRIVMSILNALVLTACWILGYIFPEYVVSYAREGAFFDSLAALFIVMFVLVSHAVFQTRLYKQQSELSEEKTREVEEMNKAQSRFFSSMSHEIRTPINTVLGLNEIILRQEDISEEVRKDSKNIQGAGRMLLSLINDILDVSKIEAGKMDIVPVDYNVSSLLSEIVNMIWLKADEKGLKFNVDVDPNVPEVLFGDEVRIKQILINLLNNAVKYTKEGSLSLHLECDIKNEDAVLLKISVSDTGMGIKQEALPHLFDTFKRVDEQKNRYIEGTGLGLSIVKQLVELMDGSITVNSVYGEGTTFLVSLNQGISSEKKVGDISITGAGKEGKTEKFEHSFHAPDARILIVDDNEMNLSVEEKLLLGTEMKVDLSVSGADALVKTLQNRYDVIFMDHLMPEMDGIECFEKIRSQQGGLNRNVPIIALTANAGSENIELYNNTGFDGYLVKPVSGLLLEEMLLRHLPKEKVISSGGHEMTGQTISTAGAYVRKRPVAIATSSMSDLPTDVVKELGIGIIPYKVITDEGVFFDNYDIDSEELVTYMGNEMRFTTSEPPTEEELIRFFAAELKKAHHLIYITLTTGSSREYGRALKAAKSFENVTVFNSECLSSSTGMLVLAAVRMAQQNQTPDRIVAELEEAKKLVRCSFVIQSTDVMARRERISPFVNSVLNTLWLRPVLRMKDDKLGVGKFLFGNKKRCYEKYIKNVASAASDTDSSLAFVTYAGMAEEELLWIEQELRSLTKFEKIIFQKASAGITSNCGPGTFGILYMAKGSHNYNLGGFFAGVDDKAEELEEEDSTVSEAAADGIEAPKQETVPVDYSAVPETGECEWYEKVPGIDYDAAVRNSGSKDAFLSVLRIFYDSYPAKSEEIEKYYDLEDWEDYKIKVHALKSSARLVGAIELGADAELQEKAGDDKDIEFIREHHDGMMDEYKAVRDVLEPWFGGKKELPDIPADMLEDAYAGLSEFAEAMDYELAKMVIDSVGEYKLPAEDEDRFERLSKKLSMLDWDGIRAILGENKGQEV
ncbi:MAG: DegV family EDD domain-containing protein [Lachnospiraceae bacterium]|nr:DegV family EDD domain-containing protein [Lachnospiraceae bacterium]